MTIETIESVKPPVKPGNRWFKVADYLVRGCCMLGLEIATPMALYAGVIGLATASVPGDLVLLLLTAPVVAILAWILALSCISPDTMAPPCGNATLRERLQPR